MCVCVCLFKRTSENVRESSGKPEASVGFLD